MKPIQHIAAAFVGLSVLHAQDRFQQEALILTGETEVARVWIGNASATEFLYYETERGVDSKRMRISQPDSIWLMEPEAYSEAVELYQGRNFEEARAKFAGIRKQYLNLRQLPDNHSSLSAYYEMESLRQLGKLDELMKAYETFTPDDRESLSREHQKRQLEMYAMWDAIREKAWSRVESIAKGWLDQSIPGYQRAQAGYALGLALEGQNRPMEAIDAYNIALIADTGASERIAGDSALNSLRLYLQDEPLQLAMKLFGTEDEEPNSAGARRLEESASLAALYQLTLGGGDPLPSEYQELLKYVPSAPVSAPAPTADEEATADEVNEEATATPPEEGGE